MKLQFMRLLGPQPERLGDVSDWETANSWSAIPVREDIPRLRNNGEYSNVLLAVMNWRARFLHRVHLSVLEPAMEPVLELLRYPNNQMIGRQFWYRAVIDYDTAGNAYWYKLRRGRQIIGLQRISPWSMTVEKRDGQIVYRVNRVGKEFAAEEIIHWKHIPADDGLVGYSPAQALVEVLSTDLEAAKTYYHILRNSGFLGLIMLTEPQQQGTVDTSGATRSMLSSLINQLKGAKRGSTVVASGPIKDVKEITGIAGKMDLKHIFDRVEERVAAGYGLTPQILGFGAGAENPQWGDTSSTLAEAAVFNSGVPLIESLLEILNSQLMPDFGFAGGLLADWSTIPEMQHKLDEARLRYIERAERMVEMGMIEAAAVQSGSIDGIAAQLLGPVPMAVMPLLKSMPMVAEGS